MLNDEGLGWYITKVLAVALRKTHPKLHFGGEGSNQDRFYLDVDLVGRLTESDLEPLAKEVKHLLNAGLELNPLPLNEVDLSQQPLLEEIVMDSQQRGVALQGFEVIDRVGERLLNSISLGEIGARSLGQGLASFTLNEISGAFLLGDSSKRQMLRISGLIQPTPSRLEESLRLLEERRARDHKSIGRQQNIYLNSPNFGQGFPAWLEDGMLIKRKVADVVRRIEWNYGFEEVSTPIFGHKSLYELSGHLSHYQENMFPPLKLEGEELILRPMTCPHHLTLFTSKRWSYRELPKRYCESSRLFRYEASGALSGLERVRSMELTEGHILLRVDQIKDEIKRCFKMIQEAIDSFEIKIDHVALSTRSAGGKFYGNNQVWRESEGILRDVIEELGIEYKEEEGEAAFYGPKIDVQIKNHLGRVITLSTIQLDYYLPMKFNASYTNNEGEEESCVLIHRGLLGTYERFVSILLEQFKGNLPF